MANVMIRMKDETVAQADRLQKKLGAPSRSDVVRRALDLSDMIATSLQKGDRLIIEGRGKVREIVIPGLNNDR